MPRKVIQIVAVPGAQIRADGCIHSIFPSIVSLCDDGTIWRKIHNPLTKVEYDWKPIEDVPQDSLESLNLGEAQCLHCGLMKRNKYSACNSCGSKHNK